MGGLLEMRQSRLRNTMAVKKGVLVIWRCYQWRPLRPVQGGFFFLVGLLLVGGTASLRSVSRLGLSCSSPY